MVVGMMLAGTAQAAEPAQERAVSTALKRAQKFGTVESVAVAPTTLGDAEAVAEATTPAESLGEPSSAVEVVTVKGQFVYYMAHTPRGYPSPTGTEMTYTIDKATGFVYMIHVGGTKLGTARMARVKARNASFRAKAASRHPRAKAASWGNGCGQAEGHHCYAIAEWYMPYTGGKVEGAIDIVNTTWMDVPGWAEGDFVDQEGWTDFPGTNYWVESGATSGDYMDCCSVHPFWAKKNAEGYWQGVAGPTLCCEVAYQEMSVGGGRWSFYWQGRYQEPTIGGLPIYSEWVQAGLEVAAYTKPSTSGAIDTAVWWTTGAEHNWSYEERQVVNSKQEPTSGLCIGRDGRHPALGNITIGTC